MMGMFFHRLGHWIFGDDPVDSSRVLLPKRACHFGEVSGSDSQSR
jgi:hypothetical protein